MAATRTQGTLPTAALSSAAAHITQDICIPRHPKASPVDLPHTEMTLHWMFIIVGLVCMALSALFCLINLFTHLIWRNNFNEQRQIMRITILPIMFGVFSWCSVVFYGIGPYLTPIPKLYEIYCVVCFFQFMIAVLAPDDASRDNYFASAVRMNRSGKKQVHDKGSLRWYRVMNMIMYLSLFISFADTILLEVLETAICTTGKSYEVASGVLTVISFVCTISVLMVLIRVYRRFRREYQGTKVLSRFWTFKSFVWVILHQQFIIFVIQATKVVKPTTYMSLSDWIYGIPQFMATCEAFIFSIVYITTLSGLRYRRKTRQVDDPIHDSASNGAGASLWMYLLSLFFPWDIFTGFWSAICTFFGLFRGRSGFDYTNGTGVSWRDRHPVRGYKSLEPLPPNE